MTTEKVIDAKTIFTEGRTYNGWLDKPVSPELLTELYHLLSLAPTSANSNPARFVFIESATMKRVVAACADEMNRPKIMGAPITVVVASDTEFYEHYATLFPARPEAGMLFKSDAELARDTMERNTVLAGGYFILAARALGLDCGPMSGFSRAKLDEELFPDGRWKSNFLCNIGYGDPASLWPRNPRLDFDTACRVV